MDVVRQNVKDLGGWISIESEEGRGTGFVLTLPLTLAISDGTIINVGSQTLVVPLAHVVESLRPNGTEVQGMGSARRMLNVRRRFIPDIPVAKAISEGAACREPEHGVLIVVGSEVAGQAALLVYSRLAPLVRNTGSRTFALHLDKVRADPAERARMIVQHVNPRFAPGIARTLVD